MSETARAIAQNSFVGCDVIDLSGDAYMVMAMVSTTQLGRQGHGVFARLSSMAHLLHNLGLFHLGSETRHLGLAMGRKTFR